MNASHGAVSALSSVEPGHHRRVRFHRRTRLPSVSPLAGSRQLRAGVVLGRRAKRRAGAEAGSVILMNLLQRSIHARVTSCALIVSVSSFMSDSHRIHNHITHRVHLRVPCMKCTMCSELVEFGGRRGCTRTGRLRTWRTKALSTSTRRGVRCSGKRDFGWALG